jgi:hypothetical protein
MQTLTFAIFSPIKSDILVPADPLVPPFLFLGNTHKQRVLNIIQLWPKPMPRKRAASSQEQAERIKHAQASIGRRLREEYDVTEPLPERLADLVRKIEQPTSESQSESPAVPSPKKANI